MNIQERNQTSTIVLRNLWARSRRRLRLSRYPHVKLSQILTCLDWPSCTCPDGRSAAPSAASAAGPHQMPAWEKIVTCMLMYYTYTPYVPCVSSRGPCQCRPRQWPPMKTLLQESCLLKPVKLILRHPENATSSPLGVHSPFRSAMNSQPCMTKLSL